MKNLLLGLCLAVALGVNAQIEAGKIMTGGSIGFSTENSKTIVGSTTTVNSKTFNFNFLPEVGYMLSENLGAGLGFGYDFTKVTTPDFFNNGVDKYDQVEKYGALVIAPFARYYKSTGEKAYAFAEFALPIQMGSEKDMGWNNAGSAVEDLDPIKYSIIGVQLSLGFNYFLNDKCALEAKWAALGFQSYKRTTPKSRFGGTDDVVDKQTNIGLGLDMTAISIGLRVFI